MSNTAASQVHGNVDHDEADEGKPVKVGGVYNATDPAVADGDRTDLQTDAAGRLKTADVNYEATVLPSAARTEAGGPAYTSSDITSRYGKGVTLFLDISAAGGTTPTLDVKVQAKDPVSGNYVDIAGAAFAQQTTTGTLTLTIYPGIAETANVSVSDALPFTWRVHATVGSGAADGTFTFSVGASIQR